MRFRDKQPLKLLFFLIPTCAFTELGYVEPWGTDAGIEVEQVEQARPSQLSLLAKAAEKAIVFHQEILSATTGPRSHFKPSSSHYTLGAIREHGFIQGFFMGCDRLMRENPDPWVYKTTKYEEKIYKWDPPFPKYQLLP